MTADSDLLHLLPEELQAKVEGCILEPKRMEIGTMIGQGHFGRVYLGRLHDDKAAVHTTVAIKTLRGRNPVYNIAIYNNIHF